ncbi:MAG: hypothetical protein ACU837_03395 [Gammaproteobacteria bacterium]
MNAKSIMVSKKSSEKLKCDIHGTKELVLCCQHLAKKSLHQIFFVPSDEEEGATVWCSVCEDARILDKGWYEYADSVANWTCICSDCFSQLIDDCDEYIEYEGITTPDEKPT